jgi:hypothetical protein
MDEPTDCIKQWREFSSSKICLVHSTTFNKENMCPFYKRQAKTSKSSKKTSKRQAIQVSETSKIGEETSKRQVKTSNSIYERLHNYGISLKAQIDWDSLNGNRFIAINKYGGYYRLDFDDAIVKVFKKSILIVLRSSKEISNLLIDDALKLANDMVKNVLSLLPKSVIVFDGEIASLHNAFVNHPAAKLDLNIVVDGEKRIISDRSHGNFEFEAVSPVHGRSDSKVLEDEYIDLISNPHYKPSTVKGIIDTVLGVQVRYAEQIEKHLLVQDKTLVALEKIGNVFDAQKNVLGVSLNNSYSPLSPNRSEKVGEVFDGMRVPNHFSSPTPNFGFKTFIQRMTGDDW